MLKTWFIRNRISTFYYNIKNGISNLIIWFPVVWRNRPWDHYFIYDVLHKQLTLMERNIRLHGHHVHNLRDAKQIKLAINLLDRLIKDDYHENVFKHHDKKWGDTQINWKEINGEEFGYKDQVCALDITRDNVKTDEQKAQERKEFRRLTPKVEKQRKQDIDFLFNYMKKHIQGWWD